MKKILSNPVFWYGVGFAWLFNTFVYRPIILKRFPERLPGIGEGPPTSGGGATGEW